MAGLLDHRLVVVTGKGGVGKSTVAAALGVAAARAGRSAVVAEVAGRTDVARPVRAAGAAHISIDPEQVLEDYLVDQLPSRTLAELLTRSRMFGHLAAATPGMRELLTVGQVWDLASGAERTRAGAEVEGVDVVILDAPATGHALAMLSAPRTFSSAARLGPVARQGAIIHEMLRDPAQTAVVAVATPEEMPVNETASLRASLQDELGLSLSLVVANRVRSARLTSADARALERSGHRAAALALGERRKATAQQGQLARLRRGAAAAGTPVITLPLCLGEPDTGALARRLERAL